MRQSVDLVSAYDYEDVHVLLRYNVFRVERKSLGEIRRTNSAIGS